MPFGWFVALLGLLLAANLVANGIWTWAAVRLLGVARPGIIRSVLVALAASLLLVVGGLSTQFAPPILILLAIAAGIGCGIWAYRRAFGLSMGRAAAAWFIALCFSGIANIPFGLVLRATWVTGYEVSSNSMAPTLPVGSRFLADRTLEPRRFDLVVFQSPQPNGGVWVKRIYGLPGETVEFTPGGLLIDKSRVEMPGAVAQANFARTGASRGLPSRGSEDGPVVLGPGEYFVVGDNVEFSLDSRNWDAPYTGATSIGAVPKSAIIGVVRAIYAPRSNWRIFR